MKRPAIDQLVYEAMFPRPKPTDPRNFNGVLSRFLVFEVRQEVHSFYGHLDTQEAKYPGLDYSNPIHRIRLSRWPWHRRLFRAIDALRLTRAEIGHLTKWEGTKWAKDRYEKEQNICIQDTAADGMPDFRSRSARLQHRRNVEDDLRRASALPPAAAGESTASTEDQTGGLATLASIVASAQSAVPAAGDADAPDGADTLDADEAMDDADGSNQEDSDDGVTQSIGLQLNERLRERVAAHNAGDTSQPLDEDWEQWLKSVIETGDLTMVAQHIGQLSDLPFVHSSYSAQAGMAAIPDTPVSNARVAGSNGLGSLNTFPPHILDAARRGSWDDVPEFLHGVLRQALDMEETDRAAAELAAIPAASAASPAADGRTHRQHPHASTWRRTYSDLRLPGQ